MSGIAACFSALCLVTGRVPTRFGPMIRREKQPGLFWFSVGLFGLVAFAFAYGALYASIPWPRH